MREHGLDLLPWDERARQFRARGEFAHRFDPTIVSLSDAMLVERLEEWLAPLLTGKRRLADVPFLSPALEQLLGYDAARKLDRLMPPEFISPAGSRHTIDYSADGGPIVEVRAQALFGLSQHPMIANGTCR